MLVQVSWRIEFPDECVPKLIEEAVDRGCGSRLDCSPRTLIEALMMDGGEDAIQQILQDLARSHAEKIGGSK